MNNLYDYRRKFVCNVMLKLTDRHINIQTERLRFNEYNYIYIGNGAIKYKWVIPGEVEISSHADIFDYIMRDTYTNSDHIKITIWKELNHINNQLSGIYKVSLELNDNTIDLHFTSEEYTEILKEVGAEA